MPARGPVRSGIHYQRPAHEKNLVGQLGGRRDAKPPAAVGGVGRRSACFMVTDTRTSSRLNRLQPVALHLGNRKLAGAGHPELQTRTGRRRLPVGNLVISRATSGRAGRRKAVRGSSPRVRLKPPARGSLAASGNRPPRQGRAWIGKNVGQGKGNQHHPAGSAVAHRTYDPGAGTRF